MSSAVAKCKVGKVGKVSKAINEQSSVRGFEYGHGWPQAESAENETKRCMPSGSCC